jgi:hypothetical protein
MYGLFAKTPGTISPAERSAVAHFLDGVEARWGTTFRVGHDPSLRFMAHCWEDLRVHHKPLVSIHTNNQPYPALSRTRSLNGSRASAPPPLSTTCARARPGMHCMSVVYELGGG